MCGLAELDGDVDALIRIVSKDLSHAYSFLRVADLCAEHGRYDDALDWAQRGIQACGKEVDERLLTFCTAEYQRRGDADNVEAFAWQRFTMGPTAEAFAELMRVAKSIQRHQAIRERALAYLYAQIKKEEAPGRSRHPVWYEAMRSVLVQVLLAEQDDAQAWTVFNGGSVPQQLWAPMAQARGKTHPHDAIALYHRLLPITIEAGRSGARYDEAFKVLKAIGQLRSQLGEQAMFAVELEAIRAEHRAKRNFMKLVSRL